MPKIDAILPWRPDLPTHCIITRAELALEEEGALVRDDYLLSEPQIEEYADSIIAKGFVPKDGRDDLVHGLCRAALYYYFGGSIKPTLNGQKAEAKEMRKRGDTDAARVLAQTQRGEGRSRYGDQGLI